MSFSSLPQLSDCLCYFRETAVVCLFGVWSSSIGERWRWSSAEYGHNQLPIRLLLATDFLRDCNSDILTSKEGHNLQDQQCIHSERGSVMISYIQFITRGKTLTIAYGVVFLWYLAIVSIYN